MVDAEVVPLALAVLGLREQRQPARDREVDRLGDVEAEVEALVVGRAKRDDELALALDLPAQVTCAAGCPGTAA